MNTQYIHVFTCGECTKFRTENCPWEGSLNEPCYDSIAFPECLSYPVSVVTTSDGTQHLLTADKKGYHEQTITIEQENYTSARATERKDITKKYYSKKRKNAKIKKLWKQSQKQEK